MLVLCHRGYHVNAPENTIEAIEEAILLGVDGVEIDIQITKDDLPILFHERLAPDGREVSQLTIKELNQAVGYRVSTLHETLKLAANTRKQFLWNFEIKTPSAVERIITTILPFSGSTQILLSSFWHSAIEKMSLNTQFDFAVLVAHYPIYFNTRPTWLPPQFNVNTIIWNFDRIDSKMLFRSKSCGLKNFVYGAITANDHKFLVDCNVDGIITDYPNLVYKRSLLSKTRKGPKY